MASIARARISALTRLRCQVFQTSYNPSNARTGAKYLRRRLMGPALLRYYPEEIDVAAVLREFKDLHIHNEAEAQRLLDVEDKKMRGKGPPKKIRTKQASKRQKRKR